MGWRRSPAAVSCCAAPRGVGTVAELWLPRAEAARRPAAEPRRTHGGPRAARCCWWTTTRWCWRAPRRCWRISATAWSRPPPAPTALERLRDGAAIDLVITDYAMPGMTGLQLAEALRRLRPGLPVLLATGYAELRGEGTDGLPRLDKPFEQAALARATEACLGGVRAGTESG